MEREKRGEKTNNDVIVACQLALINSISNEGLIKLNLELKMCYGPPLNSSLPQNSRIVNIHVYICRV
jgi:hypothetical protein